MYREQSGRFRATEAAVAAYREALKEYTRERVPLDWAMTQTTSGSAVEVGRAGERNSATGSSGRGISRGAEGADARTCAAAMGDDAEQPWGCADEAWGSGRAERRNWKQRSRHIARPEGYTRERVPAGLGDDARTTWDCADEFGGRESERRNWKQAVAAISRGAEGATRR